MTIPVSAGFLAALASPTQTFCTLLRVTRTDGNVYGFTDLNVDLIYDDGSGSLVYVAAEGYQRKDVASALDLSVDNSEFDAMLVSPAITEADLHAGLWDFAEVSFYLVNASNLTQGHLYLRRGWLGKVTIKRDAFTAELRGLMQAYSRTIGELTSPSCRAEVYDARCKVDPASFTVTSTLTGVSADGLTLYDTARTEPGPTGGVVIASISKANPGVVTLASGAGAGFAELEPVMLSGILGGADFPTLNASTIIRSLSGDTWHLGVSTSAFTGSYTANSGTCTPLGGGSAGYFDAGLLTMTSGLNAGLSVEVGSYVPGQWTIVLPFPYALAPGDAYTMLAGCDKSLATCKAKFSNVLNFRGEPYLPGIDKIVQVGKQ